MPGPDDYIRKPFSQRLLLERVRAVLRRAEGKSAPVTPASIEAAKQEALVCAASWRWTPSAMSAHWEGKPVRLTVTEFF